MGIRLFTKMESYGIRLQKFASIAEIKADLVERTEIPLDARIHAISIFPFLLTCPNCFLETIFLDKEEQKALEKISSYECKSCGNKTEYMYNYGDIIQKTDKGMRDRFLREVRDLGSKINPRERVASLGKQYIVVMNGEER